MGGAAGWRSVWRRRAVTGFLSRGRGIVRSVWVIVSTADTPQPHRPGPGWARFILPVVWMVAIFFASGQDDLPEGPKIIPHFDKVAHFCIYGLLATLWVRVLAHPGREGRAALLALAIASLYGMTDEFHQSFVPGRMVDVGDWVADTAGAALAVALYHFWPRYRAALEWRPVRRAAAPPPPPVVRAAREPNR